MLYPKKYTINPRTTNIANDVYIPISKTLIPRELE